MSERERQGSDETSGDAPDERPLVDISLIEATLRLTPEERLRQNDRMANLAAKLRDAFAAGHEPGK